MNLTTFLNCRKNHKVKRELTFWEKIFATYITEKGLLALLYKELLKIEE